MWNLIMLRHNWSRLSHLENNFNVFLWITSSAQLTDFRVSKPAFVQVLKLRNECEWTERWKLSQPSIAVVVGMQSQFKESGTLYPNPHTWIKRCKMRAVKPKQKTFSVNESKSRVVKQTIGLNLKSALWLCIMKKSLGIKVIKIIYIIP